MMGGSAAHVLKKGDPHPYLGPPCIMDLGGVGCKTVADQ